MKDTEPQFDDPLTDVVAELATLRDELHLKVHLAGMEAREAWDALQPRLHELERGLKDRRAGASRKLREMAENLHERLSELREAIARDTEGGLS